MCVCVCVCLCVCVCFVHCFENTDDSKYMHHSNMFILPFQISLSPVTVRLQCLILSPLPPLGLYLHCDNDQDAQAYIVHLYLFICILHILKTTQNSCRHKYTHIIMDESYVAVSNQAQGTMDLIKPPSMFIEYKPL